MGTWVSTSASGAPAQELHQVAGPPLDLGAATDGLEAVPRPLANRSRVGAPQYHFPLAVDRKAHGATQLELQRVADMLGHRHLPLARDGGRHAISPKYYRQE